MANQSINTCSCDSGSSCCGQEGQKKNIQIDFLYLDLNVCERCQGTESNLDQAIHDVSAVLKAAGYEVIVNKINITSPELAIAHQFLSSPTIKINGHDIAVELNETTCKDCGDLCGDTVDCRSWSYEGTDYSEPPKEMIVNAIMKAVYGGESELPVTSQAYVLPENLINFFNGLDKKVDK